MANAQKRGLGNGLGSLLSQDFDTSILLREDERIQKLSLSSIEPNVDQPRRQFDETALKELAASVKEHGILQPIVVMPHGKDGYEIVAGERRWRAAKIAKLTHIPAIVRTLKELERLEIAIVENVQRVDLSPLEQATSVERLHQQFNLSYDQIAQKLGKASSTVNNIVRLLQLPDAAREALSTKSITEGHARAILALRGQLDLQLQLLEAIIKNGWSVREAERFVLSFKSNASEPKTAKQRVETETNETKALSKRLKTQVFIKRTARGGRLEITFSTDEELSRIITYLK